MKVNVLVKQLMNSMHDPNGIVFDAPEWRAIISQTLPDISSDIAHKKSSEIVMNKTTYQVDLSGTAYDELIKVLGILLEDSNGKFIPYDYWTYYETKRFLDLSPPRIDAPLYDPANFPKICMEWAAYSTTDLGDDSIIELSLKAIPLLRKMCIKEAINRVMMDRAKLDRYRSFAGEVNEYWLMQLSNNLTREIERDKLLLSNKSRIVSY